MVHYVVHQQTLVFTLIWKCDIDTILNKHIFWSYNVIFSHYLLSYYVFFLNGKNLIAYHTVILFGSFKFIIITAQNNKMFIYKYIYEWLRSKQRYYCHTRFLSLKHLTNVVTIVAKLRCSPWKIIVEIEVSKRKLSQYIKVYS